MYRFNSGTETLDVNYTPTNNAALNGNVVYDCIHWAPVGNRDDLIAGTSGGSLHLYNFTGSAVNHLKRYDQGTGIESLDWAPTSTYVALGFTTGPLKTYQHTASTNNITYKNSSVSIPSNAYSLSWKPNATELTAGFYSYAGYDHQVYSFNSSTYALNNVYNIEVGTSVFCIRYSNSDGSYIARADSGTRYLSIYKESYSPLIFKDVNLFLNSNLTIGSPLTFQGNCTINGRGNSMTFTGDGTVNVATNSKLNLSNSTLFFRRPNAFAMQGKTSQIVFDDITLGLGSNVVFGDGAWESYNDVNVTGPYTFAYATANTSTIHANSYLKFTNGATFAIGKTKSTGPSILEFESDASHLVLDNATLNVTDSGLIITKGIIDVYGSSNFIINSEELDTNIINTEQSLVFGDGLNARNDPWLILHGNGTNLTVAEGSVIFDTKATTSMLQFQGQSQLSFDATASTYFKRSIEFTDGWMRPVTNTSFYIEPGQFITTNNVRFDYRDIFADYNVTGTLINPTHTLLGPGDSIFVNRGNSVENLTISGDGAIISGIGGPFGSILLDQGSSFIWNVAGMIGLNAIDLNGGRIIITQDTSAAPGFTFQGTGTIDLGAQTFAIGTEATEWSNNIYWDSNGGVLKINSDVTISGIWTFSGNLLVDGQGFIIDLAQTGTIILERGAHVEFANLSLYNISRQTPIVCNDNNCKITLNFSDVLLDGDYLFDTGSIYVYYNSTLGIIDGLDGIYTFTYASTQTSTIDTEAYFEIRPNTRFSIGRQNSAIINPEQQPLVFVDPLTSKIILNGGTLHVTSSGMLLTKGTMEIKDSSIIEIETPKYEYGLIFGDGTSNDDFGLKINPGVELDIKQGRIFYENSKNNRIVFSSPASSINIQSQQGFSAKTGVNFSNGWLRFNTNTPFYIDPSAYLTLNNQRFEYPSLFYDYTVSGTLVDSSNITLGSNDSIAVTRGNSIENILIAGQDVQLSGVGGPLGTITFADNTATLIWDVSGELGLNTVNLNGGKFIISQNTVSAPGFTFVGTGTIDVGSQTVALGTGDTTWSGNLYWDGNGGMLKSNNNITIDGIWTVSGNMAIEGNDYLIDLAPTGTIILERGAHVTFQHMSLYDISRQTPIVCKDNDCQIKLIIADLVLAGDYLFDKGSLFIYYDSTISIIDGLDGTYTFTYASTQTSTIDSFCSLKINPSTRFSIGRQNATITDPEQQPLVFVDPLTSKLILNGGTLHITSSGMILSKGIMEVQSSSNIEVDTPKYEYGLVLGDGTLDNDFELYIDAGVELDLKTGRIFYQNNKDNRIVFGSPASSLTIESPYGFLAKTDLTLKDGTLTSQNATGVAINPDSGVNIIHDHLIRVYQSNENSVQKRTVHGGVRPYKLLNGDSYYITEGFTTNNVVAQSGTSYFGGPGSFGGTLTIHDHSATLQTDLLTPLFCNISLNGGTLICGSDTIFANDYVLTGSGKVQFLGTKLSFGPDETNLTSTLYLQGLTSGAINLNSKASLSSTWTFGGLMQLNGNGNVLDLTNRGVLTIRPGATLDLENIALKGIGSGKGNINFMSDSSTLKLANVYLELDNNFSTTIGGIIVSGPTTLGTKNYNWLLSQNASMTIDGVTLWQDPLDKTNYGKLTFGSGPGSKYLTLVSSGTIKTATNLDLVTQSTSDMETQIRANSNTLLYLDRINSNAIIRLDRTVRTDSNAFARGIRNNSNAIIKLAVGGDSELARTTSNALLYCCRTTSAALLLGDRVNSNAIVSICVTTSNQFVINNSNTIVWLNQQLQTIDHGPNAITINSPTYQLISDIFLSNDHTMNIQNSTIINGNGHSIYCACPANGVIDIAAGSTISFHHVAFRNYTDAVFNLGAGASVIFGDGVNLELLQEQALERQWTFTGNSRIYGNGNELAVYPYAIEVAPHSALTIHGIALTGLRTLNLHGDDNSTSIRLSEATMYLDHNFSITTGTLVFDPDVVIVGTGTFTYASDATSSIARDSQLYMSGITFNYAPPTENRDLFAMVDQSSRLFIDGCTLSATITGMRLTRGTLIADHKNFLDNAGATSISEGFSFGDGNPEHDLSIEVKPGGSLNLIAGQWDYRNSND